MIKPIHQREFKSTCSYCGVGCGVHVTKQADGKLMVEGDETHPGSKGMLCSKGMNLHYTAMDRSDRLLYPEMRWNRQLPMQRVTWDTALSRAAAVFRSLIQRYGPDSVGFYVSGQCLTEEYYIINKLTKGFLGTNNIDTNSRLCMSSAVVGYKQTLGEDSVPLSYEDIELADCFFITGANPAWCHPIIFRRLEAHKAAHPEVKIIVADPRKTQSAQLADLHLPLRPGTDITLYHAIARVLIENGWIDNEFILDHTDGFDQLRKKVFETTLEEAASICELPASDIYLAAQYIAQSKGFISMWAMGLNQSVIGVNKNVALINLSLITGKIGKPGCGPFSLTGQPNAMGGREVGGLCNLLPAHRNLGNPEHRREVEQFWGSGPIPDKPGYSATEMFDHLLSGKMKAVWIVCTNPLVSLPDARNAEIALKNARFVVVQDISRNADTLQYADLILPAAAYMEKEGSMTNSDRRISYLPKIIDAPGEALPDIEIITRFAKLMGFEKSFNYSGAADIYNEYTKLTQNTNIDISGLSFDRLKNLRSVQWPVPHANHSGTPRLFTDHKFYTPNGKAQLMAVPDTNHSEKITPDFPLILTTGRIRDQWHTMTRTGKVKKLKKHIDKAYLEIHPEDARVRNIKDKSIVEIINPRGTVRVVAQVTDTIKKGVVFLPMHWGRLLKSDAARANNLTNNLVDPQSKEPDLKFAAVEVQLYRKPKEKIILIGAGAAACQFVTSYRQYNEQDELVVFSNENHTFYNRVMLPEYFSGKQNWNHLLKLDAESLEQLNIDFQKGNGIKSINPGSKEVTDSLGHVHGYDRLILCTGSRPNLPKDTGIHLSGVLTIRRKEDADQLKERVLPGHKAFIVGGGLLGLEMADALNQCGAEVTVLVRGSRLMDKQLDQIGSELLHLELKDKGIQVIYQDEVLLLLGKDKVEGLRLKSGRRIDCDTVLYAIGTQPNVELAKSAGLEVNRGVVVSPHLQSSDPYIFALGEIAEYNKNLYGITAAAEEQAEVLAAHFNGDVSAWYEGSVGMNILKVEGLQICSIGIVTTPLGVPGYEEVIYLDKAKRYYKKCIVHNDTLVGAILIGDKSEFAEFRDFIRQKTELSDKRLTLLLNKNTSREPVMGKLVCSCNNVGEGNLEKAIRSGCHEFSQLCNLTGAGTGCGSCKPEVKSLLEKHSLSVEV